MKSFTTTHKVALNAFRPVTCSLSFFFLPPVTSHMGVMGESSDGTPPRGSGSTEALPGIRNTRANRRWSQRKGSLVSSLPGSGVVRGRWSWEEGSQEQKNERKLSRSNYVIVAKAFPFQFTNSFGRANKAGAPFCSIQINVLRKSFKVISKESRRYLRENIIKRLQKILLKESSLKRNAVTTSHTNSLLSIILLYKWRLRGPMNVWHPKVCNNSPESCN